MMQVASVATVAVIDVVNENLALMAGKNRPKAVGGGGEKGG